MVDDQLVKKLPHFVEPGCQSLCLHEDCIGLCPESEVASPRLPILFVEQSSLAALTKQQQRWTAVFVVCVVRPSVRPSARKKSVSTKRIFIKLLLTSGGKILLGVKTWQIWQTCCLHTHLHIFMLRSLCSVWGTSWNEGTVTLKT